MIQTMSNSTVMHFPTRLPSRKGEDIGFFGSDSNLTQVTPMTLCALGMTRQSAGNDPVGGIPALLAIMGQKS
jgi:hypothetical protein